MCTARRDATNVIKTNLLMFFISFLFHDDQPEEDVGDIFQDQPNMAAILMRKHLRSGDLLMVSIVCLMKFVTTQKLLNSQKCLK